LQKKHADIEAEQRQKITELMKDLKLEEEKLLNTIDALNHSNKQGDQLQKTIDKMLIELEETQKKHNKAIDDL